MIADIIICAIVLTAIGFAVKSIIKKKGGCCDCDGCSCGCGKKSNENTH